MKQQEIEVRALVKDKDVNIIRDKILATGAKPIKIMSIHDVYYCDNKCKTVTDAEMNKVGSFSVRIRKETKDGKEAISYNKKIINLEGDHNSWEEIEEPRDNFEEANNEMLGSGYKFFFSLDKKREKFILNEMEICLEDIKDFGLGLEVEILASKEESEKKKLKIKKFLTQIGIQDEDIVPKSITNIIMYQRAFRN